MACFYVTGYGGAALAASDDWGYGSSSQKPEQQPLKAGPPQRLKPGDIRNPKGTVGRGRYQKIDHGTTPPLAGNKAAADDWIELYNLVSKEPLSDEQKSRLRAALLNDIKSGHRDDLAAIVQYWPSVKDLMEKHPLSQEGFAALFRALLRFQTRSKKSADADRVAEVLGPERIAHPGDPPLTEEAVDAYADMACFMYEQNHPGKTIDATDNRAIFASVIMKKYEEAPTPKDQRAMANFALTWAKFKISWALASDEGRQGLVKSLEAGTKPPHQPGDELIDRIIRGGPWAH